MALAFKWHKVNICSSENHSKDFGEDDQFRRVTSVKGKASEQGSFGLF